MAALAYWTQVAKHETALRESGAGAVLHLMSLDTPTGGRAGQIVEATVRNAAVCLTRATHRVATSAEVASWEAAQAAARDIATREADSKSMLLSLMPELVGALKQRATPAAEPAKKK